MYVLYLLHAHVHAKSPHLCLPLCDPMNYSPPGFSVHGILQARIPDVSCHALLQGIFLTQGLNAHLLSLQLWQAGSLPLAHMESPSLLHTTKLFLLENTYSAF